MKHGETVDTFKDLQVARPFALRCANRSSSLQVNFGYGNIEFLSNAIKQLA